MQCYAGKKPDKNGHFPPPCSGQSCTLVWMPNPKFKSSTESIKQVPELVYLHGRSQREIMTQEHRMQDDVQFNLCTD